MKYRLSELYDRKTMQDVLDGFCEAVGIASAVIDLEGEVFVGSRWQRICTDFHRVHPETNKRCIESDTYLANQLNRRKSSLYTCRNGLTDAAAPIFVEGEHVANFLVGQFVTEPPDRDYFRLQAAKFSFPEASYQDALSSVPVVSPERLGPILDFLVSFAGMLGAMGLDRIRQLHITRELKESSERLKLALDGAELGMWDWNPQTGKAVWSARTAELIGYKDVGKEPDLDDFKTLVHPDDWPEVFKAFQGNMDGLDPFFDVQFRLANRPGPPKWVAARGTVVEHDRDGKVNRMVGTILNITGRKRAEAERLSHLRFLEGLDGIERAMSDAENLEHMMSRVLEKALSIFECDRTWVIYPCDPGAPWCRVLVEKTLPHCPQAFRPGEDVPVTREMARSFTSVLNSKGPVVFFREEGLPLPVSAPAVSDRSSMSCALFPKVGKPWILGLSDHSHPRVWRDEDRRLFQEICSRIADSMSGLILMTDLRESEERYRAMFDYMKSGVAVYQPVDEGRDFVFTDFNRAAERISAIRREEVIGRRLLDLFPGMDTLGLFTALQNVYRTGRPEYLPAAYHKDEVREGWRETFIYRLPSGEVVAMYDDVSDRKLAEEALQESEHKYRSLFEQSGDAIIVVRPDGEVVDANPACEDVLGAAMDEIVGSNIIKFYSNPSDRQRFLGEMEKTGYVRSFEWDTKRKDGTRRYCVFSSSAWKDRDGTTRAYLSIVRDVTESRSLQEQLIHAQKLEAVGTLAGGIAHDFNNLLQVIQGFADISLMDVPKSRECRSELQEIRKAARTAAELTQGLLTFSRRVKSKLRPVDMNNELRQVARMLERTLSKMIFIDMRLAGNLCVIKADPAQLQQVIMNLAVNARDAMADGGRLTIETQEVKLDEQYCESHLGTRPGTYVLLSVSDTGAGMDKITVEQIFDPFFTTKASGKGTGLGLSIVFGIVKNHGGSITCHSEPGRGTTFKIYLPAMNTEKREDHSDLTADLPGGNETILVVDDEETIGRLGEKMLTSQGYTVHTAHNGRQCLELLREYGETISLVILDLLMPEMGGRECLSEIMKIAPDMKVLIASGYASNGQMDLALKEGARASIRKPFEARQILLLVRQVLDGA